MAASKRKKCCACGGDGMVPEPDSRGWHKDLLGLIRLASGKWICAPCVREGNSRWAVKSVGLARSEKARDADS